MVAGLLVGVWVARYLGPVQFGQLNYALAFVALFGAIAGLGLNGIVVRDLVKDPENANTTLGTAFVLQGLGGLVAVVLIIGTMAWLRPDDAFTQVMVTILSFSLIFKSTEVVKYWFESQVQSRYTVWIENGVFLFVATVKVAMILSKASLLAFVWVSLAEAVVVAVGLLGIYAAKGGGLHACHPSINRAKSLLKDGWPLLLSGMAVMMYMRVDMLMLEEMAGTREVGIYAAATRISEILYFLPIVIVSSISPSIIKTHDSDRNLYIRRLRNLYFVMVWLAIAMSLTLSLFSGQIISVLFGHEFKDAAPVLAIHLWASVAVFLGVASSQHLLVEQLQKISFYRTLVGLVCNIVLNFFLIPNFGAMGAAMATVISYFVATFSLLLFNGTRRHAYYLLMAPFTNR
jgi:PST family polysaccharide transporter